MTRILLMSLNYAPEETGIAPYSTGLAEHLADQGYRVSVLAGMPHYPAWRVDSAYTGMRRFIEDRNGVRIIRRAQYVPRTQSAAGRALYEATSLGMLVDAVRSTRPHAILGVIPSLSSGVIARSAAKRFGVPYGLIFQDLMGAAAAQSGIGGGQGTVRAARAVEGWAARGAAAVGVIAEGFRPYVESLGVEPSRIRRVRNWTHVDGPAIERSEMRRRLGWPADATVCLHAGNMGYKQGLENIVECSRLASACGNSLLFVLMGDGNQRATIERLAGEYALPNLRLLPLQPAAEFSSVLAAADILLLNQRGSVAEMSLPSKLTSYYAVGRPVVAAAASDSETAREIVGSSGGLVVAPDDAAALLEGLHRVAGDPGLAAHLAASAQSWAQTVLSKDAALRSCRQLVAAVLASGRRGRVHVPAARITSIETGARKDFPRETGEGNRERWAA